MIVKKEISLTCGKTYILETKDNQLLEVGDVFMDIEEAQGTRPYAFADFKNPSDYNKRVLTICTMVGCTNKCKFCASAGTFKRLLSDDEIIGQVLKLEELGIDIGRPRLDEAKELRILLTRMGEPILNLDNVISAMRHLISIFPNVIFGFSTTAVSEKGMNKLLSGEYNDILKHCDFQFSLHSTENHDRANLFRSVATPTINKILEYAEKIYDITGKQVGLNFILFEGFTYNFKRLADKINSNKIWIRLSPFNQVDNDFNLKGLIKTEDVINKKAISSQKLKNIINNLNESGISYSWAPAIDEEIKHNVACGQALVAYNKETKMTKADKYFKKTLKKLLKRKNGTQGYEVRPKYADGTPAHTYYLTNQIFEYNISKGEFPLISFRPQAWKSAIKEILWIYQNQSNDLSILRDKHKITWWDEFESKDKPGTIGQRYGATVAKYDMINKLIDTIKSNPFDRRMIMDMLQFTDLEETDGLFPCAYSTTWNVRGEYLDVILNQRSSDFLMAWSINQAQYVALQMMIAHAVGLKPGKFTHVVGNLHIYDRHLEAAKIMHERKPKSTNKPVMKFEPESNDFYSFKIEDFKLEGYEPNEEQIKLEIAI